MLKLFIALPLHRASDITPECDATLSALIRCESTLFEIGEYCRLRGSPNIYMQRYNMGQKFLQSDCDYFLYFDSDQYLVEPVLSIERLLRDDKDIISPIIVRKIFPHLPALLTFKRKELLDRGEDVPSLEDFRKYGDRPFEVYYSCGGVVLIKRKVIEMVDTPFYPVITESGELLSVDYSLYYKAKKEGFSCWVEPRVQCPHIGTYSFLPEDYYALIDSKSLNIKRSGKKYEYTLEPKGG